MNPLFLLGLVAMGGLIASSGATPGPRTAPPLPPPPSKPPPKAPSKPPPKAPSKPPPKAPAKPTPPMGPEPTSMSEDLQRMVADSLAKNTADVLTTTAYVVEKAGFRTLAAELRSRAQSVSAKVPPPTAAQLPNVSLDPSMPRDLAESVARQLQLQGNPDELDKLARELRQRGYIRTAEQVEAKALQIRNLLDTAATLKRVEEELKKATTVAIPARPQIPSTPVPQTAPPQKSNATIAAEALAFHLNELIKRKGSVAKARYNEDKNLVKKYQSAEGVTADGLYGPATALVLARHVGIVPPPFYWPKIDKNKALDAYRSAITVIADQVQALGEAARAELLRQSALKTVAI